MHRCMQFGCLTQYEPRRRISFHCPCPGAGRADRGGSKSPDRMSSRLDGSVPVAVVFVVTAIAPSWGSGMRFLRDAQIFDLDIRARLDCRR